MRKSGLWRAITRHPLFPTDFPIWRINSTDNMIKYKNKKVKTFQYISGKITFIYQLAELKQYVYASYLANIEG